MPSGRLLVMFLFIGCAKEQPYDLLEMPDKKIFSKSIISEGVDDVRLGNGAINLDEELLKVKDKVKLAKEQTELDELKIYRVKLEQKKRAKNSEFLFLVSTLGAPRNLVSSLPNFQGEKKIVKFRLEKDGIRVYQVEEDARFADNSLNERPILTIPVEYLDFKCATNDQGDCTNKEVLDDKKDWKEKKYFSPDFDQVTLTHFNELKIWTEDSCFTQLSQKATHVELTKDVLNIEVEREYGLKSDLNCLIQNFDFKSFAIKNSSFKIRYFYSMVRLNQLASRNYRPIEYPVQEHLIFGLFKDRIERLGDNFDPNRPQSIYYLNRFNPGKDTSRVLDFYLSDTFNKPENHELLDATHYAVERVNQALEMANAKIQINLIHAESKAKEKRSGDIRYNTIVLVDEPLANGLLGYGPSVSHPRTGEILQAHTNMYSGTLKSTVRRAYQAMVRLSRKALKGGHPTSSHKIQQKGMQSHQHHPFAMAKVGGVALPRDVGAVHERIKGKMKLQASQRLGPQYLERIKFSKLGINHGPLDGAPLMDFENLMKLYAQNNAYHVEMIHFQHLGEELMPEMKGISSLFNGDGTLKEWEQLNRTEKAEVSRIIMVNIYVPLLIHELGHNLGLRHNFMGSVDVDNFYTKKEAHELGMTTPPPYSSQMDYHAGTLNRFSTFGKYDVAALRYAYAREVELAQLEEIVKIPSTLTKVKADLIKKRKKIKSYRFCTDEGLGRTPLCNYFDAGTNLKEIATFFTESYRDAYEERNWRNGRMDFTTAQLSRYVSGTMRQFRAMRKIYEVFELYSRLLGSQFMLQGCGKQVLAMYPQYCFDINNIRDASLIVGNFFINILKTPDHTCALSLPSDQEKKTVEFVRLADIYNRMKIFMKVDGVPRSCFDPLVQSYLAAPSNYLRRSLRVKGEAGKYLNSIKDPSPLYPYAGDIQVRGTWTDKILAMRYLVIRLDENTNNGSGSLIDIPILRDQMNDFLGHIVIRSALSSPIKFLAADGSPYEENHFELADESYQISENPSLFLSRFFGLPDFGQELLNKALIINAIWFNRTKDFERYPLAEQFEDSLSVLKTRRTTPLMKSDGQDEQKELIVGKYKYIAEKENGLAFLLMTAKEDFDRLSSIPMEVAIQVFKHRNSTPEGLDEDTLTVLQNFTEKEIKSFVEGLKKLGDQLPSAEKFDAPFSSVIKLGVEGLQNILIIIKEKNTHPVDASPEVQIAYGVSLATLGEFIHGHLEKRIKPLEKSLKLLFSPSSP